VFAEQPSENRVPSIRAIRAQPHVGQPRAQRLREYLATGGGETRSTTSRLAGRSIRGKSIVEQTYS
jgi:hypothetical protein